MNNFKTLDNSELLTIDGGIAPILIGLGIAGSLLGGAGLGYGFACWLG